MSIAADQTRLRRITNDLLPAGSLDQTEAGAMLLLVRAAAGADGIDAPPEHAIVQSIAQHICALSGLRVGDVLPLSPVPDDGPRDAWLRRLGAQLSSRATRELAYAFIFLTLVADLAVTPEERAALDAFQRALDIDDRRATDLVVILTETVASPAPPP